MSAVTPDRDMAAACVRTWLHNPRPVRFQRRTGIRRWRQAAELRAAGLTYKEIAAVMRCSEASVGNFLRYGRRKHRAPDTRPAADSAPSGRLAERESEGATNESPT
jgi:hypothetical protein